MKKQSFPKAIDKNMVYLLQKYKIHFVVLLYINRMIGYQKKYGDNFSQKRGNKAFIHDIRFPLTFKAIIS